MRFGRAAEFLVLCSLGLWGGVVSSQEPVPVAPPLPPVSPLEQQETAAFVQRYGGGMLVSESFLRAFVNQENCDQGPVRDRILGADVTGTQTTKARSEFDFVRNPSHLQWFVHLRGTTRNCTTSFTPQAVIRSEGEYRFQLSKQVDFRGTVLETRSPAAFLETRQRNIGASTPADGIPLVGPLISMAAFMEAENRRPLAERIAADRLTRQIAPQFNDSLDKRLAELNQQLERLRQQWPVQIGPLPQLAGQSGDLLGCLAIREEVPAATRAPRWDELDPGAGVSLILSAERVNLWLRQLPLAGQQIQDLDLDRMIRRLTGATSGEAGPALPGDPVPMSLATLLLDTQQPLSVEFPTHDRTEEQIQPSGTIVELRAGLRPVVGDEIPTQRIRFLLSATSTAEEYEIQVSVSEVLPLDPNSSLPAHDLVRQVLKQQIESRLQPIRFSRIIPIPQTEGSRVTRLRLEQLVTTSGWLKLQIVTEPVDSPTPAESAPL